VLKIENEIEEIPQSVGVRQGDNMAPVLFLFLMTAFAQTLELEWKKIDIPILSVMTAGDEHLADGKICSHTPKMVKSKKLTTYEILECLYVNDGAFPFDTREDMQRGMERSTTTLRDLDWKCTLDAARRSRRPNASFPPLHNSSNDWSGRTLRPPQFNVHFAANTMHTPDTLHRKKNPPKINKHPFQRLSYTTHCPPRASPLDAGSLSRRPM
jgi:hypothetical protein